MPHKNNIFLYLCLIIGPVVSQMTLEYDTNTINLYLNPSRTWLACFYSVYTYFNIINKQWLFWRQKTNMIFNFDWIWRNLLRFDASYWLSLFVCTVLLPFYFSHNIHCNILECNLQPFNGLYLTVSASSGRVIIIWCTHHVAENATKDIDMYFIIFWWNSEKV